MVTSHSTPGAAGRLWRALVRRAATFRALARARRETWLRLAGAPMERILVVCYGNIYRSAFVGEYLRKHVGSLARIRSAGFHPVIGRCSPARHIEMAARRAIELRTHRSAVLTGDDVRWADTIVIMDRHNWLAVQEFGGAAGKIIWLGALATGPLEIADPYLLGDAAAERILDQMQAAASALVARIRAGSEAVRQSISQRC